MTNYYAQYAVETAVQAGFGDAVPLTALSALLTLIVIGVIAVYVLAGLHQGFLKSAAALLACLLSLLLAWCFTPMLSKAISKDENVVDQLIYYSDAKNVFGSIDIWSQEADSLSGEEVEAIVKDISIPKPLGTRFVENVAARRFDKYGAVNLADYMSYTIAYYALNTISFLMLFITAYVILYLLIHMADSVFKFPLLRYVDVPAGGILGFVRGIVVLFVAFTAMPTILTYLPLEQLSTVIHNSRITSFFMNSDSIIYWIHAWL